MEFILPIFPVRSRGVYTSDIPCTGRGVYYLVNRETLLELRSKLRSDALPITILTFLGFEPTTHRSHIVYLNTLSRGCCQDVSPVLVCINDEMLSVF